MTHTTKAVRLLKIPLRHLLLVLLICLPPGIFPFPLSSSAFLPRLILCFPLHLRTKKPLVPIELLTRTTNHPLFTSFTLYPWKSQQQLHLLALQTLHFLSRGPIFTNLSHL